LPSTGESMSEALSWSFLEGLLLRNALRIRDDFERLWLGLVSIMLKCPYPTAKQLGVGKRKGRNENEDKNDHNT